MTRYLIYATILFLVAPAILMIAGVSAVYCGSISALYEKVNPTVVVIHTVERGRLKSNPEVTDTEIGLGSGVVISKSGLVLTAAHLVQVADAVEAKFIDGLIVSARILGTVNWADVGLLQLESVPENLAVAEFGDSSQVQVGDNIFIIGAPRNLAHTLTVGYISGKRSSQYADSPFAPEFLQTDAAINDGNSGGPMFDEKGNLIGIVSQQISITGGSEGLGLSVAINVARKLLLKQQPFWLGAELYALDGQLASALNVPQPKAVLVHRVAKHSPAQEAGLRGGDLRVVTPDGPLLIGGDIILAVDGREVTGRLPEIEEKIRTEPKGKLIRLDVLRGGKIISLSLPR